MPSFLPFEQEGGQAACEPNGEDGESLEHEGIRCRDGERPS